MSQTDPADRATALPRWFTVALTGACVFVGAAGVSGIALLVLGWYQPLAVSAVGALAALASARAVARGAAPSSRDAHRAALAAVGVTLVFLALTGVMHSEHVLVERDPGAYVNTARSIAGHDTLTPRVRSGPFENPRFVVWSPGFVEESGRASPVFLPMLPVLLALGWSAGGYTGLFLVPPILGALGLLVCYALAARLMGPRWAVLVPLLLAINPLQSWFARDAYSELVVQVVALGGIWLYLEARGRHSPRIALISGLLIGTSVFARFDALAIVAALVAFAAIDWTRADAGEQPREARRVAVAFGFAMLVVSAYSSVITYATSTAYLDEHRGSTGPLHALVFAATVVAVAGVVVHRRRPGLARTLARARVPFAIGSGLVGVVSVWAYVWRPSAPSAAFPLNGILDSASDSTAWQHAQFSWSVRWFTEWFGLPAVALAVVGILILGRRALRGNVAATAVVVVVAPLTVLYILRPNVSPDQPWAMRRYLPVVIPGVVIAVVVVLHALTEVAGRVRERGPRLLARVAVVVLAGAAIVPSAVAAAPIVQARAQHGAAGAVEQLCAALPSDAAVLEFPASYLDNDATQTVRGFCGVPTARDPLEPDLDLAALARAWRDAGRSLYLVSAAPTRIVNPTHAQLVTVLHLTIGDKYAPQYTWRVRPRHYQPQPRQLWLLRVVSPKGS